MQSRIDKERGEDPRHICYIRALVPTHQNNDVADDECDAQAVGSGSVVRRTHCVAAFPHRGTREVELEESSIKRSKCTSAAEAAAGWFYRSSRMT